MFLLKALVLCWLFSSTVVFAQEKFVPPDEELWRNMAQAFSNLSMPAQAHQQVQAILKQVEDEARKRANKPAPPLTEPKIK